MSIQQFQTIQIAGTSSLELALFNQSVFFYHNQSLQLPSVVKGFLSLRAIETKRTRGQTSWHPRATEGVPLEPGAETSVNSNDGKKLLLLLRIHSSSPVPPQVSLALGLGQVHLRLNNLPPDLPATKTLISSQQTRNSDNQAPNSRQKK